MTRFYHCFVLGSSPIRPLHSFIYLNMTTPVQTLNANTYQIGMQYESTSTLHVMHINYMTRRKQNAVSIYELYTQTGRLISSTSFEGRVESKAGALYFPLLFAFVHDSIFFLDVFVLFSGFPRSGGFSANSSCSRCMQI